MSRRIIVLAAALAVMAAAVGCSVNTELGGTAIPNSRPDTRITGQPPTLLEASYAVRFHWTGSDPDGRIVGYQWKISDNGVDGISPRDTLTQDPLTGAVLHPWRFTTAKDSTFLVLADQAGFPGDSPIRPRSFRSHSLFVRAVDDKGAVDPTPAMISFTSTTLVPAAKVEYPGLSSQGFRQVPRSVTMGWSGYDDDYDQHTPVKSRYLWKRALDLSGNPVRTPTEYNLHYAEIINFDDPAWSPWNRYAPLDPDRRATFKDQDVGEYYLFAVQVQDTAGAVSVGLGYQIEVGHVRTIDNFFKPVIVLSEQYLGQAVNAETSKQIPAGQPLNFIWTASAAEYNGKIASYRHGWDLVDETNPNDPGWAVPPGLSPQNLFASQRSYLEGNHTFTLRVEDDSRQVSIYTYKLRVIPYVAREFQQNLLVLDQTVDNNVQNWPDQSGRPRNSEVYRNQWWHFLADGIGGVAGINWERDWRDHAQTVTYEDLVKYKVVLCYAQYNQSSQLMFQQFRPVRGIDNFVWLTPYQERGGNLFLVGGASMESFLEGVSNYMVPLIFTSRQETYIVGNQSYVVGFGTKLTPEGERVQRGPQMYPYATAGISTLDWTSPNTKTVYGRGITARFDRAVDCVGLKGLVLDEPFRAHHTIGSGAIADTMWTDPEIDWNDVVDAAADTMKLFHLTFPFRNDEFVDADISGTPSTPYSPQLCTDGYNGLCVEPMYRGIARFDFIREYRWAEGETEWPQSRYTDFTLDTVCGPKALTSYNGRPRSSARTNGQTFGYFSYKAVSQKPDPTKADVYWGFDPYRFDHEKSRKAIRWVLQYFGLQINQ